MFIELIGYVSGGLITVALLPQVLKAWRTKSTTDISIPWMLLYLTGLVLCIVYGFGISSVPIILTTALELLMAASLLVLKLRYK